METEQVAHSGLGCMKIRGLKMLRHAKHRYFRDQSPFFRDLPKVV
jgi:hypothetical protein